MATRNNLKNVQKSKTMWRSHWRDAMTGSETETRRGARRGPMSVFGPTPYLEKESEYSTKDRRTGGVNSIESQQTFQQSFYRSVDTL